MTTLEPYERYRGIVDDWGAFADALREPLPTCLWTNTLRARPQDVAARLAAEGPPVEPIPWHPGAFRLPSVAKPGRSLAYLAGLYHIQEEVSLIPARLLGPRPGHRVLDCCAAPGGKTAGIAVGMEDRGTLVANDRNAGRLGVLRRHLSRLGITCCAVTVHDAASLPTATGLFDRVLVDAPCSCEGTVRKTPGVAERLLSTTPGWPSGLQRAILRRAVRLCKPGGRIVYSTCTFAPEENEAVVDSVLRDEGPPLRLLEAHLPGLRSEPGLTCWGDARYRPELAGALRVLPHHQDTGGFFAALLERLAP